MPPKLVVPERVHLALAIALRLAKAGIAPLNLAIIEGSFPGYVCTFKFGPLFPKLIPGKFGKRGGNGTKVVGRWVRSFDLKDKLSTMCLAR